MKSSTWLSLGLLGAVSIWMLSGSLANVPEENVAEETVKHEAPKMKVRVLEVQAESIMRQIVVQGELEPLRQVELRAQTASRVQALSVEKGQKVAAGTVLIKLAAEDRAAQISRAKAEVAAQQHEVAANRKLRKQGMQAENRLKSAESALASAKAELKRAELELGYTEIRAPFPGVLEDRQVELGSHVERGDPVALLVDESVLKAVGRVSQQAAGDLKLGQTVTLKLLDGGEAEGKVTYISRLGDSQTHSFKIEAEVPNPDDQLNAGVSAQLSIGVGQQKAHFLSPAVLSLSDKGQVGVKSVDEQGKVAFYPISLVRTEADGVWVSGLPDEATIITQGQGFVNAGESVTPVPAS